MILHKLLKDLNIRYVEIEHKPVFTVEEANFINDKIEGFGCKNLFLKDKNKNFYLLITGADKKFDLKQIAMILKTSRLTFGTEEELNNILGLSKGSVSPFGIISDKKHLVKIVIDLDLKNKKLLFHPNINSKTISIDYEDLLKFISFCNNKLITLNLASLTQT